MTRALNVRAAHAPGIRRVGRWIGRGYLAGGAVLLTIVLVAHVPVGWSLSHSTDEGGSHG